MYKPNAPGKIKGIKAYTHLERRKIIQKLIPLIKEQLGSNFLALAAAGSYARNEDVDFSDLELVAFVKEPINKKWEIRKIVNGLYIVVIVETQASYIKKYLDISDIWYASGADKLLPIINEDLIQKINTFEPDNINKKCLLQIQNRWHVFQEITAKTLNTLNLHNKEGLPIIFNQMVKELLIILSYLNETPFITLGSYISQAQKFSLKPDGFDALMDITINGSYQNTENMKKVIQMVFGELEAQLLEKGVKLYAENL